jgi:integrase
LVIESGGLVWNTPKTHEHRSVPFPAVLADEQSALMVGKDRESLVSTDQRGELLRNSSSRARAFQANREEVPEGPTSLFRPTPHDLRHSAASPAISAGANVKAVQQMLGHAKTSMTFYIHPAPVIRVLRVELRCATITFIAQQTSFLPRIRVYPDF